MAKDIVSQTALNHKKGTRWTEEEVLQVLSELGVTLHQSYTGFINDKHLVTFSSGLSRYVSLSSVFRGCSAGKTIGRHTTKSINFQLSKHGAILEEDFKGSTGKKHLVKFANGQVRKCKLNLILTGHNKCKRNQRNNTNTINELLQKVNAKLAEPFKGGVKIDHLVSFACGHTRLVRLDHAINGSGCQICSCKGFSKDKPAYLYLINLVHKGETLYKLGITNKSIQERYRIEKVKYNIVTMFYGSGSLVRDAEKILLKTFVEFRYTGDSPFNHTGTTEIFIKDISDDSIFIKIIEDLGLIKVENSTSIGNIENQISSEAA